MLYRVKFLILMTLAIWALKTSSTFVVPVAQADNVIPNTAALSLYVALDGNDQQGDGSWGQPFATISHAAAQATPGTTIYVRRGTYHIIVSQIISAHGTVDAPIIIRPQENEPVTFDGQEANLGENDSLINIENASFITFEGFELRNSSGRGLTVSQGAHIVVRHNRVHDIYTRGISGSGYDIVFAENEVWDTGLQNKSSQLTNGGAAAMSIWPQTDGTLSTNIVFRDNHVHDSWGEGIATHLADNVVLENNTVHDSYNANLYIDNTTNVLIQSNYLYATTRTYDNPLLQYPATGINLTNEKHETQNPVRNIIIANNLIVGTGRGINFWYDKGKKELESSYEGVYIVYNVIKDTFSYPLRFFEVNAIHREPSDVLLQNNVIYKGQDGHTMDIGNQHVWVILYNNWPDSTITLARDASNFSADPLFVNPLVGGAREGFQLQANSPNIGAGVSVPGIDYDYRGVLRSSIQTTIGFYEPLATGNNQLFLPVMNNEQ